MGNQIIISVFLLFIFCQITSFNMLGCDQYFKKGKKKKEIVKVSEDMPASKYAKLCFYLGYISVHYVRNVSSCEQGKQCGSWVMSRSLWRVSGRLPVPQLRLERPEDESGMSVVADSAEA